MDKFGLNTEQLAVLSDKIATVAWQLGYGYVAHEVLDEVFGEPAPELTPEQVAEIRAALIASAASRIDVAYTGSVEQDATDIVDRVLRLVFPAPEPVTAETLVPVATE